MSSARNGVRRPRAPHGRRFHDDEFDWRGSDPGPCRQAVGAGRAAVASASCHSSNLYLEKVTKHIPGALYVAYVLHVCDMLFLKCFLENLYLLLIGQLRSYVEFYIQ